jgi:acyl-coenzyme A synthetase/AMP-(fatty) acid ligase
MVEFRTEPLPKTPIGKILRRELRTPAVSTSKEAVPA